MSPDLKGQLYLSGNSTILRDQWFILTMVRPGCGAGPHNLGIWFYNTKHQNRRWKRSDDKHTPFLSSTSLLVQEINCKWGTIGRESINHLVSFEKFDWADINTKMTWESQVRHATNMLNCHLQYLLPLTERQVTQHDLFASKTGDTTYLFGKCSQKHFQLEAIDCFIPLLVL